jgi:hypothetical protein
VRRALLALIKALLKLILALALLLLLFAFSHLAWLRWQTRGLRAFCDAAAPGQLLQQLVPLAAQHGIEAHSVHGPGRFDPQHGDWVLYVPAPAAAGAVVCEIHDDQQMVTAARIADAGGQ